ncbi:MAG TPA: RHS repeat protein, partial [Marinobacter sp.]|nr:RHS repeat protein [Marinobacter sp.]
SRRTYYEYNGFGETIEVRNPDTGTTTFTYDEAGNVATRTDAKGQVVSYTYDALNRLVLVSSSLAGDPDIQYGYDDPAADYGIGRLTSVDDGNGVRTFDYTPEGWLAAETWTISGQVLTTSYQYDGAGLIEQITYPSGRTVVYGRNAAGEVSSVSTTEGGTATSLATQIERAPFGPVTAMTHGNGLAETRTLDLNYRTTAINVPGVHSLSYSYTSDSNIADISDLLTPSLSQSLSYDAVDRLIGADGLYGLLDYAYDASGNRTSLTADNTTQSYNIRYSNNWLLKAGAVTNTYDDNGNMVDRGGDVFTYDSFNRLVGASVGSTTALYTYNHLDQRVTKTLNGHTRLLLYDQAGNLISEIDAATGNVLAEYIWLDGTPLGFGQSGQIYHIHVDHLGTPKALTDSTGNIAWKATHSPFGKAIITSQGPTFNLRFPGQYYDAETGLHYNWHRYYDPETGRYITSDPIGLQGGINTYSYALSNPKNLYDPYGLWAVGAPLPQGVVDFSAGFGDALLLGFGANLRNLVGVDGGVNRCSNEYKTGSWASFVIGGARLTYAGIVKGGSIFASSGVAASEFRNKVKAFFRGGLGKNWRPPNLKKYPTDDLLRAGAGKSNRTINIYGAGVAGAGAAGISNCGCE